MQRYKFATTVNVIFTPNTRTKYCSLHKIAGNLRQQKKQSNLIDGIVHNLYVTAVVDIPHRIQRLCVLTFTHHSNVMIDALSANEYLQIKKDTFPLLHASWVYGFCCILL